ncbi:hypothetical protein AGMMS50284_6790 [Clostridia bacterium]|nr:hypothetical protein AGMMS50284_6790 [Clostridia bacterium]
MKPDVDVEKIYKRGEVYQLPKNTANKEKDSKNFVLTTNQREATLFLVIGILVILATLTPAIIIALLYLENGKIIIGSIVAAGSIFAVILFTKYSSCKKAIKAIYEDEKYSKISDPKLRDKALYEKLTKPEQNTENSNNLLTFILKLCKRI